MEEQPSERTARAALRASNLGVIRRAAAAEVNATGRRTWGGNGMRRGISALSTPSTASDDAMEEDTQAVPVPPRQRDADRNLNTSRPEPAEVPRDPRPSREEMASRSRAPAEPSAVSRPVAGSRLICSPPAEAGNLLRRRPREHGRRHTLSPSRGTDGHSDDFTPSRRHRGERPADRAEDTGRTRVLFRLSTMTGAPSTIVSRDVPLLRLRTLS